MASSVRINKEGIICPHFLTFNGRKTVRYPMLSSLRLIRVFVQTALTQHIEIQNWCTMYQLHSSISIREPYQLCKCETTILILSVTSKKWVSKQVLVSTYRYKTILGCDPQKMRTTIPNEEEIALKHSSLDSQLKTSAALSLSETVNFTLIGSQLSDIE